MYFSHWFHNFDELDDQPGEGTLEKLAVVHERVGQSTKFL